MSKWCKSEGGAGGRADAHSTCRTSHGGGTGDSKGATPPHVYDVLKPVLLEKEKAENRLKVVRLGAHDVPTQRARAHSARLGGPSVPDPLMPVSQEVGDKLAFVIVRPGGLKSEPATGTGVLTGAHAAVECIRHFVWAALQDGVGVWHTAEDTSVCGSITRADVADLVVKALRRWGHQLRAACHARCANSRPPRVRPALANTHRKLAHTALADAAPRQTARCCRQLTAPHCRSPSSRCSTVNGPRATTPLPAEKPWQIPACQWGGRGGACHPSCGGGGGSGGSVEGGGGGGGGGTACRSSKGGGGYPAGAGGEAVGVRQQARWGRGTHWRTVEHGVHAHGRGHAIGWCKLGSQRGRVEWAHMRGPWVTGRPWRVRAGPRHSPREGREGHLGAH